MGDTHDKHVFNDDLLANPGDLNTARELYPTIENVLYNKELIDYFNTYNKRADAAKQKSRTWGKRAITLGAIAIALAAIEIVAEFTASSGWPLFIGTIAAICGVASVVIGAFGVLFGAKKREWLLNRFMGERARQFHFQSFIALMPEIVASLERSGEKVVEAKAKFEAKRHRLFLQFRSEFERNIDGYLTSMIGPHGEADWWLHSSEPVSSADYGELKPLFSAYRLLRIKHQLGYANFNLQSDHKLFSSMPVRQAELLANISKAGIAWLLLIHVSVLIVVLSTVAILVLGMPAALPIGDGASIISIVFSVAIIVIAVVALSARAVEQGIQPEREIERYQQYRSAVQAILEQFDESDTVHQKIRVMRQMERAAFDEMRNFLRTHHRSSFAL